MSVVGGWSDERLEAVLASVADHLDLPDVDLDLDFDVGGEPVVEPVAAGWGRGRGPARWLAVAALVLVAAGFVVAIRPAREAVADWLGIGSTKVVVEPGLVVPTDLPTVGADSPPTTVERAEDVLGRSLPVVPELGEPEVVLPGEGGVLLRWPSAEITLWVTPRDGDAAISVKEVGPDAELELLADLGDEAFFIGGRHQLVTPERTYAAGNVVLWTADGLQYRLEGQLGRDGLVALARSVG